MKKMTVLLSVAAFAAPLIADLVPPPRRLNRIGHEVLVKKKQPPQQTSRSNSSQIKSLLAKLESAVRNGDTNEMSRITVEMRKFDKEQLSEALQTRYSGIGDSGWKFPRDVSTAEKQAIQVKINEVRKRLQQACEAKYPKLLEEGKLKYVNRYTGHDMPYRYERYRREVRAENCRLTILAVLEENPELRDSCEGVPIEWLVNAVSVPEPSLSVESVKATFRSWAISNMKGLSQLEREILFRWQFFCCEAEKRPWYAEFSKETTRAEDVDDRHDRFSSFGRRDRGRDRSQGVETHVGFEHLMIAPTNVAASVVAWHQKAVALGFHPRAFDTYLFEKAAKRPGELGDLHVTVSHDPLASWSGYAYGKSGNLSSVEVEFRNGVDMDEIQMAHDYCAYLVEGKNYVDEVKSLKLSAIDRSAMETACKVFADMKINKLKISGKTIGGDACAVVDISALDAFPDLQDVSLYGCRVEGDVRFSKFKSLSRFHAEGCEFDTLSFLENCENVKCPAFRDCSFVSAKSLGTLKDVEQLFLRGTKGVLDLAFLEGLSSLEQLHIEECVVTNAQVVKTLPKLKHLDVTEARGDCDWDEIVLASPKLNAWGVETTILDVGRRTLYAREMRHRRNKRTPIDFQLREAVAANDAEDVKSLLEKGASAQSVWRRMPDKWGNTSVEIVKALLDNGAELSVPDTRDITEIRLDGTVKTRPAEARGRGMDELWYLCCAGGSETNRVALLRLLLERGCDPNGQTTGGMSALTALVEKYKINGDDVEMARILLERGADVRCLGDDVRSQLGSRLEDSPFGISMLSLLMKHGVEIPVAEMNLGRFLQNMSMADTNVVELLKFLVKNGVDLNRSDNFHGTPLTYVIGDAKRPKEERIGLAALLLEGGADPNRRSENGPFGKLPLEIVLENSRHKMDERLAMADLLLKHGADPNRMTGHGAFRKPLMLVAEEADGCERILELMTKHGGIFRPQDISLHEKFRLADFSDTNTVESLRFYLDKGADPNECGFHEKSFLLRVVEGSRRKRKGATSMDASAMAVRLLLDRGADPNVKDTFGRTALSTAAKNGAFEIVSLLLERGVDVDSKDTFGDTVLSEAVEGGNAAVVKLLLERGAKFGERDGAGRILEKAARSRNDEGKKALLELLIERGLGPVTDRAIIFAWWDKEARDYLLAKSGRSIDDFDVLDNGELKSVRAKQPHAKEAYIKEMERREADRKRFEERDRKRMGEMSPRRFSRHEDDMRRREEEFRKRQHEYEKKLDDAWLEYYSRQDEAQHGKGSNSH